jgi:hypothetical protein
MWRLLLALLIHCRGFAAVADGISVRAKYQNRRRLGAWNYVG